MNEISQGLVQFFETIAHPQTVFLIIKFTILLGLIFGIRALLRAQSASLRHAVLGLTFVAIPLLLICHFCAPPWAIPGAEYAINRLSERFEEARADENSLTAAEKIPLPGDAKVLMVEKEVFDPDNPFLQESEEVATTATPIVTGSAATVTAEPTPTKFGWTSLSLRHVLVLIWAAGVAMFFFRVALAWIVVSRRVAVAKPVGLAPNAILLSRPTSELLGQIGANGIRIKTSDSPQQMPLGFGLIRKTILLPSTCFDWSDDQWRSVLLHENAHFERGDCRTNLLARIHQSIFWFHPFSTWLVNQIRAESEMACDDLVIRQGVSQVDYADMLFQVARQSRTSKNGLIATVAMSDVIPLESRVKSILSNDTTRRPVNAVALFGIACLILVTSVPLATAAFVSSTKSLDQTEVIDDGKTTSADDENPQATAVATNQRELEFVIQMKAGQTLSGTATFELELETAFGRAFFESQRLQSIKRIKDTDNEYTIEAADGSTLIGKIKNPEITLNSKDGTQTIKIADMSELSAIKKANLIAGKIVDGRAANQVTYHIRVPENYDPEKLFPAIVILHGSNMNSRSYVNTMAATWPEIANKYILIGINGEMRNKKSSPQNPTFNYTYINFAGKSKFGGYPGTDRESPALVSEVISEIKNHVPISKLFVGGHSQGGFLTYSLLMNYPELVDGAFPIAGGVIIQCEPTAYVDEQHRQLQRETPVVIVHAKNDNVVEHSYSSYAFERFRDDSFPMIRLLDETDAGHAFALLPVDDAIRWLEQMSSDDPAEVVQSVEQLFAEGKIRDTLALLNRLDLMQADAQVTEPADAIRAQIESSMGNTPYVLLGLLEAEPEEGSWIDSFLAFRSKYEFAPAAAKTMAAFDKLRAKHEKPAEQLYNEARKLFGKQDKDAGYEKYQEIVDKYYASSNYQRVKKWLDERE